MKRDKSSLEKFFSLKRHRRRFGAGKPSISGDFASMRTKIIDEGAPIQTRGSSDDLNAHLKALRSEFSGQSELAYEHARLIVQIRREYKVSACFKSFEELWASEDDFLLKNLNIRWLVSAADTFADHSEDAETRSAALGVSLLVNTMKTYESERYVYNIVNQDLDGSKVEHLSEHLVPIFSGLSMLTIGTDDTLRNLRWRLDRQASNCVSGKILREIFLRLQEEDCAFSRVRALHHRNKTAWWERT